MTQQTIPGIVLGSRLAEEVRTWTVFTHSKPKRFTSISPQTKMFFLPSYPCFFGSLSRRMDRKTVTTEHSFASFKLFSLFLTFFCLLPSSCLRPRLISCLRLLSSALLVMCLVAPRHRRSSCCFLCISRQLPPSLISWLVCRVLWWLMPKRLSLSRLDRLHGLRKF